MRMRREVTLHTVAIELHRGHSKHGARLHYRRVDVHACTHQVPEGECHTLSLEEQNQMG